MNRYEVLFPYDVVEVLNGILGSALFWMTFFLVMHLYHLWRATRHRYGGRGGLLRSLVAMYQNYKPSIALFTIVFALWLRTMTLWYVRWLKNNDIRWEDWITEHSGELLIYLTGVVIVGVVCWIRVISPFEGRTARVLWFLMLISSVAFGAGMHYFF